MQRLDNMDDIQKRKCQKCDYMNNNIPIDFKKRNCVKSMEDICEAVKITIRLKNRINYIAGRSGPFFARINGKCYIDDYSFDNVIVDEEW